MTKSDFIDFLKDKAKERESITHWDKTYDNSDDHWHIDTAVEEWLPDIMDLTTEGVVKIVYNRDPYDNVILSTLEYTYEEAVENYDKTLYL